MRPSLPLLTLFTTLTSAINFLGPDINSTVPKGSNVGLSWSTVDTDPTSFSIYLVNFVNWPPFYTLLKSQVESASGQTTVRVPCNVDSSYGFQFNANNASNLYIIYAQTPKFSILSSPTGPGIFPNSSCADPPSPIPSLSSSSPSSSSSTRSSSINLTPTCPPASTVTVTMRANSTTSTSSTSRSTSSALAALS